MDMTTPALDALADLEKRSAKARRLPPLARARELRKLGVEAKELYAAAADEAVVEAVALQSYAAVGEAMRVSRQAVNKAVVRHNARQADHLRVASVDHPGVVSSP